MGANWKVMFFSYTQLKSIKLVLVAVAFTFPINFCIAGTKEKLKITDINFEDPNFKNCTLKNAEQNKWVYADEVTRIRCTSDKVSEKIKSVTGIENFTELLRVFLNANLIEKIDVSKNVKLEKIYLTGNKIFSIDVSKNINLTHLDLSATNIENIDVSNNKKLYSLSLSFNKLENIDLSNNLYLAKLDLHYNKLESIDISKNINIFQLTLSANKLKDIDLSNNVKLTDFYAWNNYFEHIDLSNNINIEQISLNKCKLQSIILPNKKNISADFLNNPLDKKTCQKLSAIENLNLIESNCKKTAF